MYQLYQERKIKSKKRPEWPNLIKSSALLLMCLHLSFTTAYVALKVLVLANLLADEVDDGLSGLVLLALGVHVLELQFDVRQEARAVVDLLDGVAQGPGNGSSLPGIEHLLSYCRSS